MIERALADFREEAQVLRANGHTAQAASIDRVLDAVRKAAPLYLEWLSEREAMMRSGKAADYFRSRFDAWENDGLAELRGKKRFYRGVVVPRRRLGSLVRAQAAQERAG